MRPESEQAGDGKRTRRDFLKAAAVAGAHLVVAAPNLIAAETLRSDPLNVAMIGYGIQGRRLLADCLKLGGQVRFKAICDVWPFFRDYGVNLLGKYGQQANGYADYREMLAKEKGLDAVIIATPDWVHAEHMPHLRNFFAAIRDSKVKLNCPAEVGYATAVSVLKANEAWETGRKLSFRPEEFVA